jgi:hypothetical protein
METNGNTGKQERKTDKIAEGFEDRSMSGSRASRLGDRQQGKRGGKKSGSSRGKTPCPFREGRPSLGRSIGPLLQGRPLGSGKKSRGEPQAPRTPGIS